MRRSVVPDRPSDPLAPRRLGALYVRAHSVWAAVVAAVGVAIASVAFGFREFPVGMHGSVPLGAPLWAYLPILIGALLGLSRVGRWPEVEGQAARHLALRNAGLVTALALASALVACTVSTLGGALGAMGLSFETGALFGLATARNVLAWTGICLVGGRLLGANLGWTPAIALVFVLEWFGRDANGQPHGWAFATAPPSLALSWIVAVAALAAGATLTAAEPWGACARYLRTLAWRGSELRP